MSIFYRLRPIALTFLVFFAQPVWAESLVCHEPGIAGQESTARNAVFFLDRKTSDPRKIEVYVEKVDGGYYYHSNFIKAGREHATKLFIDEDTDQSSADDLSSIIMNIMFDSHEQIATSPLTIEEVISAHLTLYVDSSMFSQFGHALADVTGASRIRLVDGLRRQSLSSMGLSRIDTLNPPPGLAGRIAGCCFLGFPPHMAAEYARDLANIPFDQGQMRLLSLVRDTSTARLIDGSASLSAMRVGADAASLTDRSEIFETVRQASGGQLAIVGHVEGRNFVIRRPDTSEQLSVPLSELVQVAEASNTSLILLGCRTGGQLQEGGADLGVVEEFNSIAALKALERAVSSAENQRDLLSQLASEEFHIIVDAKYLRTQKRLMTGGVYNRSRSTGLFKRVADIFLFLRKE